ncbi:S-adenosyl-L-methionine-dependent methyltransferase [Zopfia rhizophila CBS 207.26]|uniref:S-adenosyl-L-methionine-dependent methyltransferase n=1 Tax=Zopfia rhizophila CBS 207.26 TaxID=1314779 RepID=A0A6A6DMT0_9PEZI|nr:S-adenosyl-L-methionine-dependent methyltransferase [Zopfia rhizophila CBS 207.26]
MQMVKEIDANKYAPNRLFLAMTVPKYRDGIPFWYKNPEDSLNGPFQYGHNTKLPSWVFIKQHPDIQKAFNNHMAGYQRLARSFKEDRPLLVDVEGGMGHDLKEFKAKHGNLPERLVLQDLSETIAQIKGIKDSIEATAHDFFTPQPIKGARAYYMHSVLHDWNDQRARKILQQIMPAMEKGYSKILINENVVPDCGASWKVTSLDLLMMNLGAALERTEQQWRDLLSSVGLKITGI